MLNSKENRSFAATASASLGASTLTLSLLASVFFISRAVAYPWPVELEESGFEEQVEQLVEAATQQNIQENVEDSVYETVEDSVDESLEDSLESEADAYVEVAVEASVEEQVEESVADAAEATAEDEAVDAVEEQVEESVADAAESSAEDEAVEAVEEQVEESVADAAESSAEDEAVEAVEEQVEESVADAAEASAEDEAVDAVEEQVEDSVADAAESSAEEEAVEAVEEQVEESVADAAESSAEDEAVEAVEEQVEESVAGAAESSAEDEAVDAVEEQVEESVADAAESSAEDEAVEAAEEQVEESVADAAEEGVLDSIEANADERVAAALQVRVDTEIDGIVDDFEDRLDIDEDRIVQAQWLVMAEPAVFDELGNKGYLFDTVTDLPGLGLRLAEVAAPGSFDISKVRNGVMDIVGKDRADVDLNHIYTAGHPADASDDGLLPQRAMEVPAELSALSARIGIIDSNVNLQHPAFTDSSIELRSFARPGSESPDFHGTAIASILAANSPEYRGLTPSADVFAASVFEITDEGREIASTVSLIRALDWLVSSRVSVVNVSLAGPPNLLLERALQKALGEGVLVMAAAGNGGPVASPMYPAAYESVVAITAVDASERVFRLANRGDYLALAAPGVDLRHANADGGYVASSGTSFAVPFAVAAASVIKSRDPSADVLEALIGLAKDLGDPGRDQVYGYGLLSLPGP